MKSHLTCLATQALATLLALANVLFAEDSPAAIELSAEQTESERAKLGRDWVRIVRDEKDKPIAMQTAVVRYVPQRPAAGQPQYVDLVGAVHVGDHQYYRKLNKHFTQYDALLYELVAPDGTVVPAGGGPRSGHPIAAIQTGMQEMLELEHQLAKIDYSKPNFVHADMSPDDFAASMREKNEDFLKLYFRLVGQSIGHQSRSATTGKSMEMQFLTAFFSPDRARKLKIVLGEQLADTETLFESFGGQEGTTLIDERNKVALDVLRREIEAGKQKLGIFYGAGHLQDMDERLQNDFGLRPESILWLTAWNLSE